MAICGPCGRDMRECWNDPCPAAACYGGSQWNTFTIPGVTSVATVRDGDEVTFQGLYVMEPNPNRRWWQFWKPRRVPTERLQRFTVI